MYSPSRDWDHGPGVIDSLLRHKWLVFLAVLLGGLAAYGWSARQPVSYEAVVELFLSPPAGQQAGQASDIDPVRNVRNQVEVLSSAEVLDRAVLLTGLRLSRGELKSRLTVESAGDADVITIRVLDATPNGAAELAEAVPQAQRQIAREQAETAVANLQQAQDKLASQLPGLTASAKTKPADLGLAADRQAVAQELQRVAQQKRQAEIDADQAARADATRIRAVASDEPAEPQPRRAAAVGALLGLAVSVALVSWRTGRQLRAPAGEQPATGPAPAGRDLTLKQDAPGAEEPAADEVRATLEAMSRRLPRQPEPEVTPAARAAEVPPPVGGINDFDQLTASIQRIFQSLEGRRYRLYEQNIPQMAADDVANWFQADMVVVMLQNEQGVLQVAGGVGLSSFEERMAIRDDGDLLRRVVRMGPKLVGDEERTTLTAARVPGSQADTLVVVPLVYEELAFGMLLVGQRDGGGKQPALGAEEVAQIDAWARDLSPYLRAWLLLRYLKVRLRMVQ